MARACTFDAALEIFFSPKLFISGAIRGPLTTSVRMTNVVVHSAMSDLTLTLPVPLSTHVYAL